MPENTQYETRAAELVDLQGKWRQLLKLKTDPGFAFYMKILEDNTSQKLIEVTDAPRALLSENARTYVAGECNGLRFAMNLIDAQISALESQINAIQPIVEAEEANEEAATAANTNTGD